MLPVKQSAEHRRKVMLGSQSVHPRPAASNVMKHRAHQVVLARQIGPPHHLHHIGVELSASGVYFVLHNHIHIIIPALQDRV